jgi:HK97 family phage major capsid protein
MTDSLAGDLRQYICQAHASGPRRDSHWVMSLEWFNEVRRLDDSGGRLHHPGLTVSGPVLLLGIPVEIRADAGAPRLEPDGPAG